MGLGTSAAHKFLPEGKFALLAVSNVFADLPEHPLTLSDGTVALPGLPVGDLRAWREWVGSLRMERIQGANLVLVAEEAPGSPALPDGAHDRLGHRLLGLFRMLHLGRGLDLVGGADLLLGSSSGGLRVIRRLSGAETFRQSRGYRRRRLEVGWLEEAVAAGAGAAAMRAAPGRSERFFRGLGALFDGLRQETGQERLHQFVRSLEALILPCKGRTKEQFIGRCRTFAGATADSQRMLAEAFDLRSDAEHLNPWQASVQGYPQGVREDVCWWRTRQIERLACGTYSRILRNAALREHFATDEGISAFWTLPQPGRLALWGEAVDAAAEPFVARYDQHGRAMAGPQPGAPRPPAVRAGRRAGQEG